MVAKVQSVLKLMKTPKKTEIGNLLVMNVPKSFNVGPGCNFLISRKIFFFPVRHMSRDLEIYMSKIDSSHLELNCLDINFFLFL